MLLALIVLGLNTLQNKLKHKSIVLTNIFRTQTYNSVMCGYFRHEFIDFMLVGKFLRDFTNLFSPNILTKSMTKF